jgi:hypothetical protein
LICPQGEQTKLRDDALSQWGQSPSLGFLLICKNPGAFIAGVFLSFGTVRSLISLKRMTPDELRRHANTYLQLAQEPIHASMADELRRMAAAYFAQADELEAQSASAAPTTGNSQRGPGPEEPKT